MEPESFFTKKLSLSRSTQDLTTECNMIPRGILHRISEREHSVAQPWPADSLRPHGLEPTKLPCPWDSPGKNTGVGCHALLQGIFPTRGLNPHLLYWQVDQCATWETPGRIKALGRNQGNLNAVSSFVNNASVLVLYLWQMYSSNQRY